MKSWFSRWTGKTTPPAPGVVPQSTLPAVDAIIKQGHALEDAGQVTEALTLYRQALAVQPDSVPALINEGNALLLLGDKAAAIAGYRRALTFDRGSASAWLNLGNALMQYKTDDQAGREVALDEAESAYRAAIRARPDWAEAIFGLGCVLEERPAVEEACAAYRRAIALDPAHDKANFNLVDLMAAQLVQRKQTASARQLLAEGLQRQPGARRLAGRLADLERDSGLLHQGVARMQQLVKEQPDDFQAHSVMLFALNYLPEIGATELFAAHQAYGRLLEQRVAPLSPEIRRDAGRRLRVGYISPDFRQHPVSVFIVPVLRHHDRSDVEVFCYHNHDGSDEITERIRGVSDGWRDIAGLEDERVAQMIVDDRIDLLVDLAGHTTGNRMILMARKPAPLQLTWLGYLGSTGLSRIDYRLCDRHTDPPGVSEALHSEKLLRLPDSQWCYEPQVPLPPPSPLPYLTRGSWTFGSYNNGLKLNASVFAAWAAVLDTFPGSRLRLFSILNDDLERVVRAGFADRGIASDRIECMGRIPIADYFASAAAVDVALDSFPYSGGTTTCDTLMMGLPVATIAGSRTLSRSGVSLLGTLGLQDWIAASPDELPQLLRRQLADPDGVATLRAELPARLRASALMDAPRFTRNLEQLYRQTWQAWCAEH